MKKSFASGCMQPDLDMMVGEVREQLNGWHIKKQIQEHCYIIFTDVTEDRGRYKGYTEGIM